MSISSALSSALSGLTANARAASVVSSNLANIQTEGYGRRDIALSPSGHGAQGGVRVVGITRHVDQGVLAERRFADAALSGSQTRAAFLSAVRSGVGTPDQAGSLSARLAALDAALVSASSRPEAADRLQALSLRAADLVEGFNAASDGIQKQRMRAEEQIASAVRGLNSDLAQVHELNIQIGSADRGGGGSAALRDHRQAVIDRIADLVPVSEIPRDGGAIALMTPGGVMLLDHRAALVEFMPSNIVEPHMTQENGLLSGLRVNGRDVEPAGARSPLEGGRLSALFEVRDTLAVNAQEQLDAAARGIIERFQQPGVDPTRAPGDAGLFTDRGAAFSAPDEIGIAGRMRLNTAVDTRAGNETWRLRDGLGASAPGAAGNARLLDAMADALAARNMPASGLANGGAVTAAQHLDAVVSHLAQSAQAEERNTSFAAVRQSELQDRLASDGVNSDAETQRLLLIEQAYGANARMIQTLDDMMQTILRI